MPVKGPPKVVWAVDAFEERGKPQQRAAEVVRCLVSHCKAVVHPVHILSPAELNLSADFADPWVSQYLPAADKTLVRTIADMKLPALERPTVLTEPVATHSRASDTLIRFAQEVRADLILVGSHGRTGVSRFFLGSFSETLLLKSPIPVVVVGPHSRAVCDFKTLLFPTGFEFTSKAMFRRVVALARNYGSKIILYHAIPRPTEPMFQSGVYLLGNPWIPVQEYFANELKRLQKHAEAWARWAQHQGVETEIIVDTQVFNIAKSIVALVKDREIGWIAMATQHGPIAAALLGSVSRQVIRLVDCPVWVLKNRQEVLKTSHSDVSSSRAA